MWTNYPQSFSSKWYLISFIDDFSRKTWVYLLKEKSEAFEVFKKFKVMVEKVTGRQIKFVRSDRGGEYTSTAFMKYCEEQGIRISNCTVLSSTKWCGREEERDHS